jgi:hypothetical protein
VYLLVFHAYINEMHGSRSKVPSKKSCPCIHEVKFLAVLWAPYIYIYIYIYDISRLRSNINTHHHQMCSKIDVHKSNYLHFLTKIYTFNGRGVYNTKCVYDCFWELAVLTLYVMAVNGVQKKQNVSHSTPCCFYDGNLVCDHEEST